MNEPLNSILKLIVLLIIFGGLYIITYIFTHSHIAGIATVVWAVVMLIFIARSI